MSLDGRVTLGRDRLLLEADTSQVWRSLHPPSAQAAAQARSSQLAELYHPEAILEGSGTFVRTDAGPLTPPPAQVSNPDDELYFDFLPIDKVDRPGRQTWFAVVDSRGRVRWEMTGGGAVELLVLVAQATPAAYLAYLRREGICYLVVGKGRVDLSLALSRMQDRLDVTCVVSEAGGGLNGALLRAGLVDEIQLLVLPAVVGGLGTPSLFDGPELSDTEIPTRLRLLSSHTEDDGLLWLRYQVLHHPAEAASADD